MLGKLIKHEFRATARIMLPISGAVLALSLLANLSIRGLTGSMSEIPVLRIFFLFIEFAFGAAIVAAGLCAESKTTVSGVQYLERGYESLEQTLCSLGADVKKI